MGKNDEVIRPVPNFAPLTKEWLAYAKASGQIVECPEVRSAYGGLRAAAMLAAIAALCGLGFLYGLLGH